MKNIWILNHYAVVPSMPGGTRHYDFGKELVNRGYKVIIFASSFHHGQHKELKLVGNEKLKFEKIDGVNFVWLKTFPYQKNDWRRVINMFSFLGRAYSTGRKIVKSGRGIERPDIIIGSSVHLLAVLAAYWLSKHYRAEFIMEIRDLWPQTLIDMKKIGRNSPIAIILRFLEKFLYQRSNKIIVLSPLTKDYLTSLGINQRKIHLIPNGVDMSRYGVEGGVNKDEGKFNVMYTGSLGIVNALEPFLKAIKIVWDKGLKEIKFIFVGSGVEREKLIEESRRLNMENVEFLAPVPKIEMPAILGGADVFLLIENKILYGSSNKLMDYMAAGKPIVFFTPAKHNIVDGADCGISVLRQDAESLADAIIKLYQMSSEERKKMGQRGREYVEKHHSIPVLVDKLEKVIQEVVNE